MTTRPDGCPQEGSSPDGVVLRPARPNEAAELTALTMRSKAHWGYDGAFLDACREELLLPSAACDGLHVVVAECAGLLLGYHQVSGTPSRGELTRLFVDPPSMGQGVGAVLLRDAMARGRRLGLETLSVDSDPGAEGFYLHAGAVRVGEVASGSIASRMLPRLELSTRDWVWPTDHPGVLTLPSGRRLRGRGLRRPLPLGPSPDLGLYLLARAPARQLWESCWVRWPDFGLPLRPGQARTALWQAWQAATKRRVEIACDGGIGRTGTALACLAVLDGVGPADAVAFVREHYHPRAVETPWQRRFVLSAASW